MKRIIMLAAKDTEAVAFDLTHLVQYLGRLQTRVTNRARFTRWG